MVILALLMGCVTKADGLAALDDDGDGFLHPAAEELGAEGPFDCDDANPDVKPDAVELCNGGDDDCDGEVDEDPSNGTTFYADADGDTYGDVNDHIVACAAVSGMVSDGDDCDDTTSDVNPGADEHCDGVDEDCSGTADDDAVDASDWYPDADRDGYTLDTGAVSRCALPNGYASRSVDVDCDDQNSNVHPDAVETVADGIDVDCDGTEVCLSDSDGDGFHSDVTRGSADVDCDDSGEAYAADLGGDCDDARAAVNPVTDEICNGLDDDCDADVDDDAIDAATWARDADADGFTSTTDRVTACDAPFGYVSPSAQGDCNDTDIDVNPGASEGVADEIDSNCDGRESCYADADRDGWRTSTTVSSSDSDCRDSGEAPNSAAIDCDDAAAATHPGAADPPYDGVDADCDGWSDYDADGDGHDSDGFGGDDCDDGDDTIASGASEGWYDLGIDNDCDVDIDDADPLDLSTQHRVDGEAAGDRFGNSIVVVPAGWLGSEPALVVGALGASGYTGRVYAWPQSALSSATAVGAPIRVDGPPQGSSTYPADFGAAVGFAGDASTPWTVVSAPGTGDGAGSVFGFDAASLAAGASNADFEISGNVADTYVGVTVLSGNDFDGDGVFDLVVEVARQGAGRGRWRRLDLHGLDDAERRVHLPRR